MCTMCAGTSPGVQTDKMPSVLLLAPRGAFVVLHDRFYLSRSQGSIALLRLSASLILKAFGSGSKADTKCHYNEQCLHVWSRYLDGRVWPAEDERQVKLLFAMIHHCTGESLGMRSLITLLGLLLCIQSLIELSPIRGASCTITGVRLKAWFAPKATADKDDKLKCAPALSQFCQSSSTAFCCLSQMYGHDIK